MNRSDDPLPRRREEARALFRNAILGAAEAVFAKKGFRGARIQDIAAEARIAVGTVYNHFAQKEDVLAALLEERSEELLAELALRPDDPQDFPARLEARVGRMLSCVERHRAFFAIAHEHGLFAGHASPAAHAASRKLEHVQRFRAVFRGMVEEGIQSGALEPFDADVLATFLAGTMRAFILSSLAPSAPRPTSAPAPDVSGDDANDHRRSAPAKPSAHASAGTATKSAGPQPEPSARDVWSYAAMTADLFFHGAARRRRRRR